MRTRKFLALLLVVCLGFGIAACGDTAVDQDTTQPIAGDEEPAEERDYKIAIVPKDSTDAWFVRMEVGVKEYAEDTGMNVFQKGPAKTDALEQVKVIQDLITQDLDAIGVVPVDPSALEPVLKQAMDAGIVVITHEGSSVENNDYNIEAFNNDEYGEFVIDNLAKAMGEEGIYTTMVGHLTNASHNEWADAGVAYQPEAYPNMTLLSEEPRVESEDNSEVAYQKTKELIAKYPDLKGIMGTSSMDAPGVARAIEELGLEGKFFVSGTGMPDECRTFLKNGTLASITLWDPAKAGYAMAALATAVLDGKDITDGLDLGLEGYNSLQVFGDSNTLMGQGWIVITADTVDDYDF